MLSIKVWFWSLGVFAAFSFLLCVLWGLVMPEALHMKVFLEAVLPAFRWLSLGTFLLGLVESFLWGAYVGLVLIPIHNFFYRRWGANAR